jgi:hypothetical protein
LKDGQMPRGSQETTILRIWWLNLDRLISFNCYWLLYNSLFVDLIHFSTCAKPSGEERSEARWRWAQGRVF